MDIPRTYPVGWKLRSQEQEDEIVGLRARFAFAERERDDAQASQIKIASQLTSAMETIRALERELDESISDQSLAIARAEHAESFCYHAAKAAGGYEFVCAETVPLRAKLAAAERDRDREHETVVHYEMLHANGEPCAEIRWQQEREDLRATIAAQSAALAKAREACVTIEKWSHGLRHRTPHESKMVELGIAAIDAITEI